jgi:hypothetical protein
MFIRPFVLAAAILTIVSSTACTIQTPLAEHHPVLISQTPDAAPTASDSAASDNRQSSNPGAVPH